jgi:hypothetical protein
LFLQKQKIALEPYQKPKSQIPTVLLNISDLVADLDNPKLEIENTKKVVMSFSHELRLVFQAYCDGLQEKGPGAVARSQSRLRSGPLVQILKSTLLSQCYTVKCARALTLESFGRIRAAC